MDLGGMVIEQTTVEHNATVGGVFIIFALGTAAISMVKSKSSSDVTIEVANKTK